MLNWLRFIIQKVKEKIQTRIQTHISHMANIFYIFSLLFFPSFTLSSAPFTSLRVPAFGPESTVFDNNRGGPYTSISDGRVVKYEGRELGFVDFGFTAPTRLKDLCDGSNNVSLGRTCGRPLGLGYYRQTGEIIVADAFYGLCVIGPKGGLAKQLATSAEGVPFRFPDGTDVDQQTGIIYMTDASAVYGLEVADLVVTRNDSTGRLIRYDPRTKQVDVLMRGLAGAAGMAISEDASFIVVTEYVIGRLQKYWLRGPKANTAEILLNVQGLPNKIVRTKRGDFWVASTVGTGNNITLMGYRFNGDGVILETKTFPQFNATGITEIHEHRNALYLASLYGDNVGVQWYSNNFQYTATE